MKQKLRLTITRIRRQTTSSDGIGHRESAPAKPTASFDLENPIDANPIADRNIYEINAPTNPMPDDYVSQKMTKEGKN